MTEREDSQFLSFCLNISINVINDLSNIWKRNYQIEFLCPHPRLSFSLSYKVAREDNEERNEGHICQIR